MPSNLFANNVKRYKSTVKILPASASCSDANGICSKTDSSITNLITHTHHEGIS